MLYARSSGILLHPTSLPGRFGIGDLGPEAYRFVDFLVAAGQAYWQILPLNPTGYGDSPYSTYSAFAGNTLFISPEGLVDAKLLPQSAINSVPEFASDQVDYNASREWKSSILAIAAATFTSVSELQDEYLKFSIENGWWLDDYAAFMAIRTSLDHTPWFEWAEPLRARDRDALATIASQLAREIKTEKIAQFLFFKQWRELRTYANNKGVKIIGDIPIFAALDSADVWCNQDKFKLHADGRPKVIAGVPPDYFSKTGQLWGNPIYDWEAMRHDDFGWWTARIAHTLKLVDVVRLDHFIGFIRNYEVPAEDKTAANGRWVDVPGPALFATLKQRLGELPLIAEDLGELTPAVEELRDSLRLPGMTILQYAFGGGSDNRYLPHHHVKNSVAYTGTHDNDTTAGWYRSSPKNVKHHCRKYLECSSRDIHWQMTRACLASVADLSIIPAQDLLGLGSDARMNTPGSGRGNWQWRVADGALSSEITGRLLELTKLFDRRNVDLRDDFA